MLNMSRDLFVRGLISVQWYYHMTYPFIRSGEFASKENEKKFFAGNKHLTTAHTGQVRNVAKFLRYLSTGMHDKNPFPRDNLGSERNYGEASGFKITRGLPRLLLTTHVYMCQQKKLRVIADKEFSIRQYFISKRLFFIENICIWCKNKK